MYSIGAVSRLSGVPVEGIRIWERRYGLLSPTRSAGGHRKYSDDDVELLRALKALTESGSRIGGFKGQSRAAILDAAARLRPANDAADDLVSAAIAAGLAQDAKALAEVLDRPLLLGRATKLALQLYLPLMHKVGELWHAGELDIVTEHFIEKQVTARLHTMLLNLGRVDGPEAVLLCPSGERHEAGLLGAAITLAQLGFSPTLLGADLPRSEAERVLRARTPSLLVIAATLVPPPDEVRGWLQLAAQANQKGVQVIVGGTARGVFVSPHVHTLDCLHGLEEFARGLLPASARTTN